MVRFYWRHGTFLRIGWQCEGFHNQKPDTMHLTPQTRSEEENVPSFSISFMGLRGVNFDL